MIGIVVTAMWARRGQALTLAVLAVFAVAAAVAVPAFQHAVDNAVVAAEVAAAPPGGRALSLTASVDERESGPSGGDGGPGLADIGAALVQVPGFTQVTGEDYPVVGLEPDPQSTTAMVFRQDVCANLTIVDGRCLVAEGEVVIGERTARRLGKGPGDPVRLTYARVTSTPSGALMVVPDGLPKTVVVVGVYTVTDPADQYWGNHGFFNPDRAGQRAEPLFTGAPTVAVMDHGTSNETIDATVDPAALRPDRLDTIGAQVGDVLRRTNGVNAVNVTSGIPALLDQIAAGRRLARQVVPVVAVPLVLLALFVIFLVVGYGAEDRRPELAALRLRGTRWWLRWWVAAGETVLPVAAGAVLVIGTAVLFDLSFIWYALSATIGAILVTLLAQRRTLRLPVVDLLRTVPVAVARWRLLAGEIVAVLLTAVVLVQLWLFDKSLAGVGLFAPALVVLTLGLLVSRLLPPVAARVGTRALHRGRLGPALAAFQLARRPGVQRIFLLLTAAVALLAFAASAVDVAAQDRSVAATVGTGAPRVVTVDRVTRSQLLQAVRAVDPEGRYAMAVAEVPAGRPGEAPKLAVDSSRLAVATVWPDGSLSAARAAQLLHPPSTDPVIFPSEDIAVDVTVAGANPSAPVNLVAVVSSVTGKGTATVPLGALNNGPYTYEQNVPECAGGCRLAGLHVVTGGISGNSFAIRMTLRGLRSTSPDKAALAPGALAETARWHATNATVSAVPGGLLADIAARDGDLGAWLQPADAPYPLPVVTTATLRPGSDLAGLDGRPIPVTAAGRVTALPRLGTSGTLIDLEYADRISTDAGPAREPQVWLGRDAPADILRRLGDHGLVVTGDRTVASAHRQLDRQGAALALPFHPFAAALAVLLAAGSLALVAAVDRRRRAADFGALRRQGLGRADLGQAIRWTYPLLVAAAAVAGLVIGLGAWFAAGWAVPVLDAGQDTLPLPIAPRPLPVLAAWLAAGLLLTSVAVLAERDLRRSSSL